MEEVKQTWQQKVLGKMAEWCENLGVLLLSVAVGWYHIADQHEDEFYPGLMLRTGDEFLATRVRRMSSGHN
jgi:hypothetical protein